MKIISAIILGFLTITARSDVVPNGVQKFVVANHQFTADVIKVLAEGDTNNIVTSPLALQLVMALVAEAAVNETMTELRDALHVRPLLEVIKEYIDFFKSFTHSQPMNFESFKLLYANRIYHDKTVDMRRRFRIYAEETFNIEVQQVDFSQSDKAVKKINKWVNTSTAGEIDHLIDAQHLAQNSKLVIVTNLYFQSTFKNPFLPKFTKSDIFHETSTKTQTTDFIRSYRNASYSYNRKLRTKFLELPFVNDLDELYIVFVLPDKINEINIVEKNLGKYLESQTLERKTVAIILPKFSFKTKINHKTTLQHLGVKSVFDPQTARLSALTVTKGVALDKVVQESKISLNEIGIEVGATKIEPGGVPLATNSGDEYETFNADHPFLFYVRDGSRNVLLIGKVTEPLEAYKA